MNIKNIYITGDCHGDFCRFGSKAWPESRNFIKEETLVLIAGDFGGLWESGENSNRWEEEQYWLDWLNDKKWTTIFVEGNHECHPRLESLEEVEMFGSTVGKVRNSIFHLKRGNIYNIANKSLFAFGGAMSIDKVYRKEGISWWPQESPNKEEEDYGISNLIANDMKVDFVLTHTCPQHLVPMIIGGPPRSPYDGNYYDKFYDPLTKYLEYVANSIQFEKWFFGHFHDEGEMTDLGEKFKCLYKGIYRLI